MYNIITSPLFDKNYTKLTDKEKILVKKKIELLKANFYHPSLRLRK